MVLAPFAPAPLGGGLSCQHALCGRHHCRIDLPVAIATDRPSCRPMVAALRRPRARRAPQPVDRFGAVVAMAVRAAGPTVEPRLVPTRRLIGVQCYDIAW